MAFTFPPCSFLAAVAAVLLFTSAGAGATTIVNPDLSLRMDDPCRVVVAEFERTIAFLRTSQGTEVAMALREKLVPAKLEQEILFKDGYCGLARYLKDKKLTR
jgi:hypothetical protein